MQIMQMSAIAFALAPTSSSRLFSPTARSTRAISSSISISMSLVSPKEAHARKAQAPAWIHLDVRTVEEYSRLRAPNSLNVPFMNAATAGMTRNANFVPDVAAKVAKSDKLLISCASGKRSAMAAAVLADVGYTVADVEGGMSAWSGTEGLPTESGAV